METSAGDASAVLEQLLARGARVAGDVVAVGERTWAVHGVIAVDGEVILAEFDARDAALRLLELLAAAERKARPTPAPGPQLRTE